MIAGQAPLEKPKTFTASADDVKVAENATPTDATPKVAATAEIADLKAKLKLSPNGVDATLAADKKGPGDNKVVQFQASWVQYDAVNYRPIVMNPYHERMQLVYTYQGAPRIVIVEPLARIGFDVPLPGGYAFTALRLDVFGVPIGVAVGNFWGGGYAPLPGQPPPPPPPPPPPVWNDVPVVVSNPGAVYEPFRVQQMSEIGPDPAVGGETKVLLDGATPAWGTWTTNANGERTFEVHKTQPYPGMDNPQDGVPPGYNVQLASAQQPTGMSTKDIVLIGAAAAVTVLGLGAIGTSIFLGRRRRAGH